MPKTKKETPEVKPEVKPEAAQQTQTTPKKNTIMWVIVGIVVIAGGALGYGFYKGSKTKNYATKVESIYNTSKAIWTADSFNADEYNTASEFSEKMNATKNDINSALNQINDLSGSSKTKNLENYVKDYYTKAKKYAEFGVSLGEYVSSLEKLQEYLAKMSEDSLGATSLSDLAEPYKQTKKNVEDWLSDYKNTTPPDIYKEFHEKTIEVMENVLDKFDDLISAIEANDEKAFQNVGYEIMQLGYGMSSLESPTSEDIQKDFATSEQKDELKSLAEKIINEINGLKKTTFAF